MSGEKPPRRPSSKAASPATGAGTATRRLAGNGALALSVFFILFMTMGPVDREVDAVIRLCLVCGTGGLASFLLNIALFVPFGMAFRFRFGSLGLALLAGFLFSLGIEVAQLGIPGRFTTLADLVANTSGAGLGALLVVRPERWLLPHPPLARALAGAYAAFAVLAVALTGASFAPSVPSGDWYAQWTPRLANLESFRGELLSARIGDLPLPLGLVEREEEVRMLFETGAPVEVRFTIGPPPPNLAPVLRMVAGPFGVGVETFQVGVNRHDLVVRPRYRADDLYLTRPELRVLGGMAPFPLGDTIEVTVREDPDGGHRVSIGGGTPMLLGVTVGRGWSLLRYPGRLSEAWLTAADLLWIAALLFPLGWWAPSRLLLLLLGAAPLLALGVVPLWSALLPTPAAQFIAGAGGLLLGYGVQAGVRRLRGRPLPDG